MDPELTRLVALAVADAPALTSEQIADLRRAIRPDERAVVKPALAAVAALPVAGQRNVIGRAA